MLPGGHGIMTVVHTILPAGHADRPRSLFADVPLLCGRLKTSETRSSVFAKFITCKRCQKLLAAYNEDLDYKRTQARLAIQRGIAAGA